MSDSNIDNVAAMIFKHTGPDALKQAAARQALISAASFRGAVIVTAAALRSVLLTAGVLEAGTCDLDIIHLQSEVERDVAVLLAGYLELRHGSAASEVVWDELDAIGAHTPATYGSMIHERIQHALNPNETACRCEACTLCD